jgi:hypothetical protein
VTNFLRRLPLSRLLLLCGVVVAVGIGATALAVAVSTEPVPEPKPLAEAVHDALSAPRVSGVSATIQFDNHLIDTSGLEAQGGAPSTSSPLLSGASGRLWIAENGRVRVELQSDHGDTQILYDPSSRTVSLYDAAASTLYRYQLPQSAEGSSGSPSTGSGSSAADTHKIPTVKEIQEAIEHVMRHASLSGMTPTDAAPTPTDVAGQAAYSVRISPSHDGGLVGGAELVWDAVHGVPLRLAVYSTQSSSPVLELTATKVSYGPVDEKVFDIPTPSGTKVTEVTPPTSSSSKTGSAGQSPSAPVTGVSAVQAALPDFTLSAPDTLANMQRDQVTLVHVNGKPAALVSYGKGLGGIAVLESQADATPKPSEGSSSSPIGQLPKVSVNEATATELPTALGTLLRFERSGVSYVVAGSVTPKVAQEAAKGL